jgi:hypothetical protein
VLLNHLNLVETYTFTHQQSPPLSRQIRLPLNALFILSWT